MDYIWILISAYWYSMPSNNNLVAFSMLLRWWRFICNVNLSCLVNRRLSFYLSSFSLLSSRRSTWQIKALTDIYFWNKSADCIVSSSLLLLFFFLMSSNLFFKLYKVCSVPFGPPIERTAERNSLSSGSTILSRQSSWTAILWEKPSQPLLQRFLPFERPIPLIRVGFTLFHPPRSVHEATFCVILKTFCAVTSTFVQENMSIVMFGLELSPCSFVVLLAALQNVVLRGAVMEFRWKNGNFRPFWVFSLFQIWDKLCAHK